MGQNLKRQKRTRPDDQGMQPTASVTKEIVLLMYSAMFSEGQVTDRAARDVSLECMLIGAGLWAFVTETEMPLPYKVVPDYSQ